MRARELKSIEFDGGSWPFRIAILDVKTGVRPAHVLVTLLLVVVTGLMHLIVPITVWQCAILKAGETFIAPISVAESVVVLDAAYHRDRLIGIEDVDNLIMAEYVVGRNSSESSKRFFRARWDALRDHSFLDWRSRQWVCSEASKPSISLLHAIGTDKYISDARFSQRRRPAIVNPTQIYEKLFPLDYVQPGWFHVSRIPYIGSLVNLELLRGLVNKFASHTCLPSSQSSVNKQQSGGYSAQHMLGSQKP